MIDQLIGFLKSFGLALLPWSVVDAWQKAVVLRFGKYHRTLEPGFHWMIPFVETVHALCVVTNTTTLRAQSVTMADGKVVTTEAIIRWSVGDIKIYALEITDASNVVTDLAQGAIASVLRASVMGDPTLDSSIQKEARKQLSRFGIKVEAITLTTFAPVKVIRLVGAFQTATHETQ